MINVQKSQQNNPITVIRAASGNELTNYEKQKLAKIEENAQQNKIEYIRVEGETVPSTRVQVDSETKVARIKLGDMAFKSTISADDLDNETWFFIRCDLDESDLNIKK